MTVKFDLQIAVFYALVQRSISEHITSLHNTICKYYHLSELTGNLYFDTIDTAGQAFSVPADGEVLIKKGDEQRQRDYWREYSFHHSHNAGHISREKRDV